MKQNVEFNCSVENKSLTKVVPNIPITNFSTSIKSQIAQMYLNHFGGTSNLIRPSTINSTENRTKRNQSQEIQKNRRSEPLINLALDKKNLLDEEYPSIVLHPKQNRYIFETIKKNNYNQQNPQYRCQSAQKESKRSMSFGSITGINQSTTYNTNISNSTTYKEVTPTTNRSNHSDSLQISPLKKDKKVIISYKSGRSLSKSQYSFSELSQKVIKDITSKRQMNCWVKQNTSPNCFFIHFSIYLMKVQNLFTAIRSEFIEKSDCRAKENTSSQHDEFQQPSPQRDKSENNPFLKNYNKNKTFVNSQRQAKRFSPVYRKKLHQDEQNETFSQKASLTNTQLAAKQQELIQAKKQAQKIKVNLEDSDFFKFIEIKQISPMKMGKSRKDYNVTQYNELYQSKISNEINKYSQDIQGISLTQNIIPFDDVETHLSTIHSKQEQPDQKVATEIQLGLNKNINGDTSNLLNQEKASSFEQNFSRQSTSSQVTQKLFNLNYDLSQSSSQENSSSHKRKFSHKLSLTNESPLGIYKSEEGEKQYNNQTSPLYCGFSLDSQHQLSSPQVNSSTLIPISNTLVKEQLLGTDTQEFNSSMIEQEDIDIEAQTFDGISYYKERINREANSKNKKIILSRLKINNNITERYKNYTLEDNQDEKESTESNRGQRVFRQIPMIKSQQQNILQFRKRKLDFVHKRGVSAQESQYNPYLPNNPFNQLKSYVQSACEKIQEKRQISLNTSFNIDFLQYNDKLNIGCTQSSQNKHIQFDSDCYNFSLGNTISSQQGSQNCNQQQLGKQSPKGHIFISSRKRVQSVQEDFQKTIGLKGEDFLYIQSLQQHPNTNTSQNQSSKQNIFYDTSSTKNQPLLYQSLVPSFYDYKNCESTLAPMTVSFYDNNFQSPQNQKSKFKNQQNLAEKYYNGVGLCQPVSPQKMNPPPSYLILKDFVQKRQKPEKMYNQIIGNSKIEKPKRVPSDQFSPQKIIQINPLTSDFK
ncbi:hypothetical protein ABPG73_015792 [Tetrahymena malaccensis]